MRRSWLGVVLFLLLPLPASAGQWAATKGIVSYKLVHKFHEVVGVTDTVEVIGALEGGVLKVMARAPVSSFDSGNGNRDEHMQEVMEAARFPLVVVKGIATGVTVPSAAGGTHPVTLQAEVELHGVKIKKGIVVQTTLTDATHASVSFHFTASLTAHGIERPSLLFVPVDDNITITGNIDMEAKP